MGIRRLLVFTNKLMPFASGDPGRTVNKSAKNYCGSSPITTDSIRDRLCILINYTPFFILLQVGFLIFFNYLTTDTHYGIHIYSPLSAHSVYYFRNRYKESLIIQRINRKTEYMSKTPKYICRQA